jgi:hypothetical protein
MLEANIRQAADQDGAHLLKAVTDEQDYERALHATRRPGAEIAEAYLAHIRANVAQNRGALLIAEVNGVFAGYAACWIEHDGNIAETDDSDHFGYVADNRWGLGCVGRMSAMAAGSVNTTWKYGTGRRSASRATSDLSHPRRISIGIASARVGPSDSPASPAPFR